MRSVILFLMTAALAGVAPLIDGAGPASSGSDGFPGWPTTFEGRALTVLPMTPREAAFARDFPGRVGRFSDGQREIIVRWVASATRRLHPAGDCFRGLGYTITPLPLRISTDGAHIACFRAVRGGDALKVCEVVREVAGPSAAHSWPDVPAWYWAALFGQTDGPWWNVVVAERE